MAGELEETKPVTTMAEVTEAFGLGGTLSEIRTVLGFVQKTVEKTDSTLGTVAADVSTLKVEQAGFREQLRTAFHRIEKVEERLDAQPEPDPAPITRTEFDELRTEVRAGRLTWTKLIAGVASLAGLVGVALAVLNWVDALTPAN